MGLYWRITSLPKTVSNQIVLRNEKDLHYKVINFIKDNYPDIIVIPGLGENQTTSQIRCDSYRKGYISGQPDLLILNLHKTYKLFAVELNSPSGTGIVSENQKAYLAKLKQQNCKILISDNYDLILIELIEYFREIRIKCEYCVKKFKNTVSLATHQRYFHRMTTWYLMLIKNEILL